MQNLHIKDPPSANQPRSDCLHGHQHIDGFIYHIGLMDPMSDVTTCYDILMWLLMASGLPLLEIFWAPVLCQSTDHSGIGDFVWLNASLSKLSNGNCLLLAWMSYFPQSSNSSQSLTVQVLAMTKIDKVDTKWDQVAWTLNQVSNVEPSLSLVDYIQSCEHCSCSNVSHILTLVGRICLLHLFQPILCLACEANVWHENVTRTCHLSHLCQNM